MEHQKKKPVKLSTKEILKARKKQAKAKLKEKRARLIVRNLPFNVTKENVQEYFGKFGEVDSVELLKKEDGHLKGCCFVQFKLVQKAAKAKHHLNGQNFLNRIISVDFAMPKKKYVEVKAEIKVESQDEEIKIKQEPVDVDELMEQPKVEIKDEFIDIDIKKEKEENIETVKDSADEESNFEEDDSESDGEDYDEDEKEKEENQEESKPRVISNDVSEGKTIFVKNVPFTATNEDLKDVMDQFGPVYYALICVDKISEHPKGTAFVKFRYQEDAEKALSAGTELTLMGQVLDCHKALGRDEIQRKNQEKQQEKNQSKDSRNLYLVKEGVILAGSKAAEGVSASDMAKRLQLEQYKTQMLRNLNMFISKERLIIHNLPSTWDNQKLRDLMKKYSNKNAIIREARVMLDMKNVDANGVGISKEFGFVTFKRHEDALTALRNLNNNPNIFSANRRPIVTFSIENKSMIKARQKRLEKSKLNNPTRKKFNPNMKKPNDENKQKIEVAEGNSFSGVAAKPGKPQKMRSRFNLKTQARLHFENLKKEKKKSKFVKKTLQQKRQEFTKQPKQKMHNIKKLEDNFSKIVAEYKKKLHTAPEIKKAKWYDNNS